MSVGFDPSAFAKSEAASEWPAELRNRIEATWMLLQVTFESYDPRVYPALDFFLSVAKRLADLTDGTKSMPGLAFPFQLHIGERPERGPRHILRLPP